MPRSRSRLPSTTPYSKSVSSKYFFARFQVDNSPAAHWQLGSSPLAETNFRPSPRRLDFS